MEKYFGTDGIRGKNEKFTKEFVVNIIDSLVKTLKKDNLKILVGGDTRASSETIIKDINNALKIRGVHVLNGGILPTPAISYLTQKLNCDCSIIVTASHNPYTDNGIKILNSQGEKLKDSFILDIEQLMDRYDNEFTTSNEGIIEDVHDKCRELYLNKLYDSINVDLSDLKIGIDAANGATSEISELVFKKLNTNYTIIHNEKKYNTKINYNCGSTHLDSLKELVVNYNLDFGIAYDGDGDRTLLVDNGGNEIDGDYILAILCNYFKIKDLVITVMANQGLINWAKDNNINLITTDVGDTNVYEVMKEKDLPIGGEQSGHVILRNYGMHTGDGILTSLTIAKIIKESGTSLKELSSIITKYPQIIKNVEATNDEKRIFKNSDKVQELITKYNNLLENESGRLNIRPSGTENLIRITMWGKEMDKIMDLSEKMALELKEMLGDN